MLAICVALPLLTFLIIWKNKYWLQSDVFQGQYGTLVENLKTKNVWQALYGTVQLFKWCLTITSLVLLREYPALQIITNIFIQLCL